MTSSVFDFAQRPIVDLSVLCKPIPELPKQLCITLPGGLTLCSTAHRADLPILEYSMQALDSLSLAIAPLDPLFKIMEALTSVQKTLSVIPDVIGPPPNPSKLIEELAKLAEKMQIVARLMPIFSIPIMLVQLLDVVISTLEGIANELKSLANNLLRIQRAQLVVAQAPGLAALIKCAVSSHDVQISNLERLFGSINPVIQLLNTLASATPIKKPFPLPEFSGILPDPLVTAADELQKLAEGMRQARSYIPF